MNALVKSLDWEIFVNEFALVNSLDWEIFAYEFALVNSLGEFCERIYSAVP